jgi:2-keto-3-deoxy-L-fuconate dehydrogenase
VSHPSSLLAGTRVLVTSATTYMGPAIVDLFTAEGADVVADGGRYLEPGEAAHAVEAAGDIDVLVANLATPPSPARAHHITDADWHGLFDALVHPLMALVRSALPAMLERQRGKIVAVTSAAPLRGMSGASAYTAARGAQNAFIRSVGLEVARNGVQVNAVAQNNVENDVYYPPAMLADEAVRDRILRDVPIRRFATGRESAELCLWLASDRSDYVVGQIVPFAGGWATNA